MYVFAAWNYSADGFDAELLGLFATEKEASAAVEIAKGYSFYTEEDVFYIEQVPVGKMLVGPDP
jgi:hypothetical protein